MQQHATSDDEGQKDELVPQADPGQIPVLYWFSQRDCSVLRPPFQYICFVLVQPEGLQCVETSISIQRDCSVLRPPFQYTCFVLVQPEGLQCVETSISIYLFCIGSARGTAIPVLYWFSQRDCSVLRPPFLYTCFELVQPEGLQCVETSISM
ncbi:unnamed protein product [Leuciscus chuanchicus]